MDLALQDVRRHVGRFVTTIVGVALLQAVVLTMNGMYRGNVSDGVWLIEQTRADLWIVERGRGGPFNEQSRIPQQSYRSVAAIPGVARAAPFLTYTIERSIGGRSQHVTVVGYDVFNVLGGPPTLAAGRMISAAHYELIADSKLGLDIGDSIRLGVHEYMVVGVTHGAVDSGGNPLIYLSVPDAQEVLYQQDNEAIRAERIESSRQLEALGFSGAQLEKLAPLVNATRPTIGAVLVAVAPSADVDIVAQAIRGGLRLEAFTTSQQRELMLKGRLARMTAILGLFRALLVVVSIVIIALLIYVLTVEKVRSIATLKLIGAPNWVIVRLIMEQSVVLTLAAFTLGFALIAMTKDRFPRTLVLLPFDTVATGAVILAGGMVASLVGVWRALRTPPSAALGA
ncbi:MAG: ABC transporter permease [Gemmatimonadaceae bacterium]